MAPIRRRLAARKANESSNSSTPIPHSLFPKRPLWICLKPLLP